MLEIAELRAGYPGVEVLRGLSLEARSGRVTAILGPNGCGKSTLLKALCGIVSAASGRVSLDGQDLLALSPQQHARRVAYLPQSRQLSDIAAGRLVLHGRFPYLSYPRRYREEDRRIAAQAMERMGILELADAPLSRLSGGQRQKVYLAMALAQDTDVILLDEPTTYLDVSQRLRFLRQARALADSGKHVLMVVHDLPHALEAADWVALMRDGTVVRQGPPEEVYASGALEEVFDVRIVRARVEDRWRYFCIEK